MIPKLKKEKKKFGYTVDNNKRWDKVVPVYFQSAIYQFTVGKQSQEKPLIAENPTTVNSDTNAYRVKGWQRGKEGRTFSVDTQHGCNKRTYTRSHTELDSANF